MDAGVLGVVELKLTNKNKKSPPLHEYKAVHRYANDGDEWGEIRFDFSAGTAQIVKLADGDMSRTNVFAKIAIRQILKLSISELPKKLTIPFELKWREYDTGADRCGGFLYTSCAPLAQKIFLLRCKISYANYTRTAGFCSLQIPCLLLLTAHKIRLFCCRRKVSVERGTAPFQRQRSQKV